jgi:dsRNA-specific ribonuclease
VIEGLDDDSIWALVWRPQRSGAKAAAKLAAAEAEVRAASYPKVLADLVEAVVGAVYVDSGGDWAATWRVTKHLMQL